MAKTASSTPAEKAVETFAALPTYIIDAEGNQVAIPRLTARAELQMLQALTSNLSGLSEVMPAGIDFKEGIKPEQLYELLPIIMGVAPELVGQIGAAILQKPPEEVLDTFRVGDLVEAILPFFVSGKGLISQLKRIIASVSGVNP